MKQHHVTSVSYSLILVCATRFRGQGSIWGPQGPVIREANSLSDTSGFSETAGSDHMTIIRNECSSMCLSPPLRAPVKGDCDQTFQ